MTRKNARRIFGNGSITSLSGTFATSAGAASNSLGVSAAASMLLPPISHWVLQFLMAAVELVLVLRSHLLGLELHLSQQSAPVQFGSSASCSEFGFVREYSFLFWKLCTWFFYSLFQSQSYQLQHCSNVSSASAATNTTPVSFGASSASVATSNSVATVFGMPSVSAPTTNSKPISFGASTVSTPSTNSASVFGLSNGASSTPMFSFTAWLKTTVHASPIPVPVFGQPPVSTPQSAPTVPVFGQTACLNSTISLCIWRVPNSFQFANPSNPANPQNPSPFQASSSLGLSTGGGSFSLGSGNDKSNRRFVKVQRNKPRKK
ncbi:hypothetical protein M0R45_035955 [Rubus argutus]|uniref:Uncharacterized protein n=1 Tax=Rubus argutus TaxID=59490 RepID=A0AAW1VWG1_RUBAR